MRTSFTPSGGPFVVSRIRTVMDGVTTQLGGRARLRAVVVLASVLALASADGGAVGVVAFQLEQALRIGNAQVGLAVTVSSLAGALATIPMGALADRTSRVRLLWITIALWGVAELASGLAPDYAVFLLTRIALGGVIATAGPAVASLAGDLFPPDERGRM